MQSEKSSRTGFYIGLGMLGFLLVGGGLAGIGLYLIGREPTQSAAACPVPGAPTPSPVISSQKIYQTIMDGRQISTAQVAFNSTMNQPYISFTLTDSGAKIIADFTSNNIGKYLAIAANKQIISSPVINAPLVGGSGIIEGGFTRDQVENLVTLLKNCGQLVEFVDAGNTSPRVGEIIQTTGPK